MKIPPIDLSGIIKILKKEGGDELSSALSGNKFGTIRIQYEWNNIISILETQLIPQLAKGGEVSSLLPAANALMKSAGTLSLMASQVLSFIPGPIGIVCSIINAIVCFASGNVVGGLLELLGCIPGAKFGVKGGSKLLTKIGDDVIRIIEKNPELAKILKDWEKLMDKTKLITKELNLTKIKEITDKIQKEVASIGRYAQKTVGRFDTGQTYKCGLEDALSVPNRGVGKATVGETMYHGTQIHQRGISLYSLGYGMNSQATIRLWP